jgi:hypothetical protein
MKRDRAAAALPEGVSMMQRWHAIVLHAVAAAVFMFLLQRFAMAATLEMSLLWAVAFGGGAAVLAARQTNRRP